MVTSANPVPQASLIREKDQRSTRRVSMGPADTEWQAHRRPQGLPDLPARPLSTRMESQDTDGRHLGDCKVYPILRSGHSVTGSRGCPRRLCKKMQLTRKSSLSYLPNLRKPSVSARRRGGPL